jgi:Tol biopolymer transport system component
MKNYLGIFAMLVLLSCSVNEEKDKEQQVFQPETPGLSEGVMTPELLWSFGRLGGAQVSPDGKTVLYTVTYYNIDENKSYRDIYSVPVSGGKPENLTRSTGNESNAIWRPDGERIGFLSPASGSSQIWEIKPDGTDLQQVTDIEGGISGFKYSPDGSKIF